MITNYEYILRKCQQFAPAGHILDYGCGGGEMVRQGRKYGFNMFGVEAFYAGSNAKNVARDAGLLGSTVFELSAQGIIPFDDRYFDFVVSNQVFEHVENLDLVLTEIKRVLKPGGMLLALFPASEVIREGHSGVPMIHWFKKNSALRYPYMLLMRALGFG